MRKRRNDSFGTRVMNGLRKRGISALQAAERVGIKHGTFRNRLSLARMPGDDLRALAELLGETVDTLRQWGVTESSEYRRQVGDSVRVSKDFRLDEGDLKLLVRAQKVIGDLSIPLAIQIVKNERAKMTS